MAASNEHRAAQRILSVTEQELSQIVLDIHDGPVQTLFAALAQLNVLQTRMQSSRQADAEWLAGLERVSGLLQESLGEIRALIGAQRSPEFARRPVPQMIEALVLQHSEQTGMSITLRVDGAIPPVALAAKIALYRTTQEALSNVYRHAGVSEARVRLSAPRGRVKIIVQDAGRGFTPPPLTGPRATEEAKHIGLRGMRERLALIGGKLQIAAAPGQGTRVVIEVPADG